MIIDTSDFSVIIQGQIIGKPGDSDDEQLTKKCIERVRMILPGAEIILSTWLGSDASHLDKDKIVYSIDPGAITYNDFQLKNIFNNNNRQIKSTLAGLNLASRKYSIKLRSDFEMQNSNFIQYLNKYRSYYKYKFFKERILVLSLSSRDPTKTPILNAISDLFQVGLTTDLKKLWDIPLQPEPDTTRAFPYSKQFLNDPIRSDQYKMRYNSEQYIWYAFTKKQGLDLSLDYYCQVPIQKIGKSLISLVDNFVICEHEQLGILPPKRLLHSLNFMITHDKWLQMYTNLSISKNRFYLIQQILRVLKKSISVGFNNVKIDFKTKLYTIFQNEIIRKKNS